MYLQPMLLPTVAVSGQWGDSQKDRQSGCGEIQFYSIGQDWTPSQQRFTRSASINHHKLCWVLITIGNRDVGLCAGPHTQTTFLLFCSRLTVAALVREIIKVFLCLRKMSAVYRNEDVRAVEDAGRCEVLQI